MKGLFFTCNAAVMEVMEQGIILLGKKEFKRLPSLLSLV